MTAIFHNVCPLCSSPKRKLYELSHTILTRCSNLHCGFVFAEKQLSDQELNRFYTELYYPKTKASGSVPKPNSNKVKFTQHFHYLDSKIGLLGKRVLDYGCGEGNFLEVARDAGVHNLFGVELNDQGRARAAAKGFSVSKSIDNFASQSIDIVYMNDVIEHLRNPLKELKKIYDLLSPGGVLFVATMNIKGLKARILGKRWELIIDPTHFYFYDRSSLRNTLFLSGFLHTVEARFVVNFSHHGFVRRFLQKLLVQASLDTGLKFLAWKK